MNGIVWALLGLGLGVAGLAACLVWTLRAVAELRQAVGKGSELAPRLDRLETLAQSQGWGERADRNRQVLEVLQSLLSWTETLRARPEIELPDDLAEREAS